MKLEEKLSQFMGATNESDIQKVFKELAPAFLYGGYIQVRKDYQIYIRTVEFYFHSEKADGIHDPIVYHRNKRDLDGKLIMEIPYFTPMTLHSHDSGFDITFECKDEGCEYRASALIRAYEVKDEIGNYWIWNTKTGMFEKSHEYGYNTQSTYLKKLLNGFPLGISNEVQWVDYPTEQDIEIEVKARKNVFNSESDFVYMKIEGERCKREWSFTRIEQV